VNETIFCGQKVKIKKSNYVSLGASNT